VSIAAVSSPCGSVKVRLGEATAHLRASGALWFEDEACLIVADLHFEKGSAYGVRGQMLPPYDTRETLRRLSAEVAALKPRTLVFLGDSFHDRAAESRLAAEDAAALTGLALGRTLVWVVGNHDADGPRRLPGDIIDHCKIAGIALRHEPTPGSGQREAAGHLHPCARVIGRGASVRRRCFVTDGERIVLPAFGAYAGGLNVRDAAFASLFAAPPLAVALGASRAHPVAWPKVGPD
jgi:DNA ligase-associated metallophosphoesterase